MLTQVETFFGSALLGIILNAWIVGLICMYTSNYYSNFPNDKLVVKLLVAWTALIQMFNLFVEAVMIYHYLAASWGIPENLLTATWTWSLYLGLISIAAFSVQVFYTFRIFILSGQNYLISIIILLLSFGGLGACWAIVILGMTSAKEFSQLQEFAWIVLVWLSLHGACDLLIAVLQVYYLRTRLLQGGLRKVNRFVKILLLYIISTGLLTSILVIVELVTFAILGFTFSHIFLSYMMGGIHTLSLLATLDVRRRFHAMDDGVILANSPNNVPAPQSSASRTAVGQWEIGKSIQTTSSENESHIRFAEWPGANNEKHQQVITAL